MQRNVTVVPCTHEGGTAPNDGGATHGGACLWCGTEITAEPHAPGADNTCAGCGTALKVKVESGGGTAWYGGIDWAWDAAYDAGTAAVTLLDDVAVADDILSISPGNHITLNGGSHTFSLRGLGVFDGQLDITGGTFDFLTGTSGLFVRGGAVRLSGGKFINQNGDDVIGCDPASGLTAAELLLNYGSTDPAVKHYAYFDEAGEPIALEEGQTSLPSPVTVKECSHEGAASAPNSDGTHNISCPCCGYTGPADCAYRFSGNTGTCQACGDTLTVTVTGTAGLAYDGAAKEPRVTVRRGEQALAAGTDYTVAYANNTNAGTASLTVTIGNGQGTYTATFPIARATPEITALPTAAAVTYGQALGDSALSGGAAMNGGAAVPGSFAWKTPSAKPAAADSGVTPYAAVFTPADTDNYNAVELALTLTVHKAPAAPNRPGSTLRVPYSVETVGGAPLPEGWAWQASDRDTALAVDVPARAVAVYTGADKGNYENETAAVTITRAASGELPDEAPAEPGIPFIKGEAGKTGWDVIREAERTAAEGSAINVDMNGATVVPGDIFERIRGRQVAISFDLGGGIVWSVDGRTVAAARPSDTDLAVRTGTDTVPADIAGRVTGQNYSIQISLAHNGAFGFTAVLSLDLGRENAGHTASLYYYDPDARTLELLSTAEVAPDGTASLAFVHASDYLIVIDRQAGAEDPTQPGAPGTPGTPGTPADKNTGTKQKPQTGRPGTPAPNDAGKVQNPQTAQQGGAWPLAAAGIFAAAAAGTGVFFAVKKKKKDA